jgi:hypothetical protein
MTKEALRLALGALQRFIKYDYNENPFDGKDVEGAEAITAIKAALAQPEQEPVGWLDSNDKLAEFMHKDLKAEHDKRDSSTPRYFQIPVYTTPPQRTWVGLTDEEITELRLKTLDAVATNHEVYRAIEAKLKEKNNG